MRRYAQDTSVPVGKSRGQIDTLLRQWGCKGVQWTDEFDEGHPRETGENSMKTTEAVKLVKKALWIGPENPVPFVKGTVIYNYGGTEKGVCTGATYRCQMEGCLGLRIVVRWPDGKITRPCTKGMLFDKKRKAWRIG